MRLEPGTITFKSKIDWFRSYDDAYVEWSVLHWIATMCCSDNSMIIKNGSTTETVSKFYVGYPWP